MHLTTIISSVAFIMACADKALSSERSTLETRQLNCLGNRCIPGVGGCCAGALCTSTDSIGLPGIGLCAPASCDVICVSTGDCCNNVPGTLFTCKMPSGLGKNAGVCVPQVI
ncbi:hypothetical protein C8Q79DRAFT_280649 [Trametes meyenii]|nr:hypothetical protein C8Q79DRAFT_280649 [Trametes meyenii]